MRVNVPFDYSLSIGCLRKICFVCFVFDLFVSVMLFGQKEKLFLFNYSCLQCIFTYIVTGNDGQNRHAKQRQRYDEQVLGVVLLSWRCLTKSSSYFGFKTEDLPTVSSNFIGAFVSVSRENCYWAILLCNNTLQPASAADAATLAFLSGCSTTEIMSHFTTFANNFKLARFHKRGL